MTILQSPIGLIAGNGDFPLEFAKKAKEKGLKLIVIANKGEAQDQLVEIADHCSWVKVGQLGKIIKILKKQNVKQVAFAGGINRPSLFDLISLDATAIKVVARLGSMKDDAVLRGIAGELEKNDIEVISAGELLADSVVEKGVLTKRDLSEQEIKDAAIAWEAAYKLGELDIGQSVLAHKGLVIAIEAVEGTDETIKRAGAVSKTEKSKKSKNGCVLVKLCKPHQDQRLDLPACGPQTIENMNKAGVTALVLQDKKAIMINPDETIRKANLYDIVISVVDDIKDLL